MQSQVLRRNFYALAAGLMDASWSAYVQLMRTCSSAYKPFSQGCFLVLNGASSEIMEMKDTSLW
jgi:hypothetical protein